MSNGLTYLSLFAGIGGIDLGLDRSGWTCVGQVEKDPFCQRVLAKHWPEVSRHDDVTTAVTWWRSLPRPVVDLVAGGYPCQTDSLAGPKRGLDDDRWIWPEMARVIHAVRPRYVLGENVLGHRTRGLRFVLRDLDQLGYCAHPGILRACEMGAPHPRPRLFTLAHTHGTGCHPWRRLGPTGTAFIGASRWAAEPGVGRVADGVSSGLDGARPHRLRALGNAVSPKVAEHVGRLIRAHADLSLVRGVA